MQILQPQRRVDMLRDIMDAQRHQRPYVVTFCGVNGVGKSTNLAKVGAVPQAESDIVSAAFSVSATVGLADSSASFADLLLAVRERLQCPHRCLRHISCRGCGTAADAHPASERPAPPREARRPDHGAAVREGLRQGCCWHCHGGHCLWYGAQQVWGLCGPLCSGASLGACRGPGLPYHQLSAQ